MLKFLSWATTVVCLSSSFGFSLSLKEAIQKAVEHFPDIQAAEASINASKASIYQEAAAYFPQVSVEVPAGFEYTREDFRQNLVNSSPLHGEVQNFRSSPSLTLRQVIYDGGLIKSRVLKTEALTKKAWCKYKETIDDIAFKTASAYIQIVRLEQLQKIAVENLEAHEKMLKKTHSLVDAGDLTAVDLVQVEARLEDARITLTRVENDLAKSKIEFREYTGVEAKNLDSSTSALKQFSKNLTHILRVALQENKTLNGLKKDANILRADLEGVKSKFLPTLSAEVGGNRFQNVNAARGTEYQATALLVLRYNLFDGGSRSFEKRSASQRVCESEKKISAFKLDLEKEIRTTWDNLKTSEKQEALFKNAVAYKENVAKAYAKQFDIGARSLIDILDAINDYFVTFAQYVTSHSTNELACIRLMTLSSQLIPNFRISIPKKF